MCLWRYNRLDAIADDCRLLAITIGINKLLLVSVELLFITEQYGKLHMYATVYLS